MKTTELASADPASSCAASMQQLKTPLKLWSSLRRIVQLSTNAYSQQPKAGYREFRRRIVQLSTNAYSQQPVAGYRELRRRDVLLSTLHTASNQWQGTEYLSCTSVPKWPTKLRVMMFMMPIVSRLAAMGPARKPCTSISCRKAHSSGNISTKHTVNWLSGCHPWCLLRQHL